MQDSFQKLHGPKADTSKVRMHSAVLLRFLAASIATVNPFHAIGWIRLVGVGVPYAVRADALCNADVLAVVLRPVFHVVVAHAMHAARIWKASA